MTFGDDAVVAFAAAFSDAVVVVVAGAFGSSVTPSLMITLRCLISTIEKASCRARERQAGVSDGLLTTADSHEAHRDNNERMNGRT